MKRKLREVKTIIKPKVSPSRSRLGLGYSLDLFYRCMDLCEDLLRRYLSRVVEVRLPYWTNDLLLVLTYPCEELGISRFTCLIGPFMDYLRHLATRKLIALYLVGSLDLRGDRDHYLDHGAPFGIGLLGRLGARFMA